MSHPAAHEAHEHDTVHRWMSPEDALPRYQRRRERVGDDARGAVDPDRYGTGQRV